MGKKPKPSKPKPYQSSASQASKPLKKSKTNPGLSYTSSGKAVFTPAPPKKRAQPNPSGTKTQPRATGPDGAPFRYIANQAITPSPLKISQLTAYKPAAPVVKNTPAVAAKAAVKGVKKVAR